MKNDHELDEWLRELRQPDEGAVARITTAALSPTARRPCLKRALRFAMAAAAILACGFWLARYFAPRRDVPDWTIQGKPIAEADDQELLRWVDGLIGKEIPSAFDPARLVAREVLKGEK